MVRWDKLPNGTVILSEVGGSSEASAEPEKRNKYGNNRTEVDGIMFHSAKEAKRYKDLKLMEKADEIRNLRLQVPFDLEVNGVKICRYVADFVYEEEYLEIQGHKETYKTRGVFDISSTRFDKPVKKWRQVVEDVKGHSTREYQIKKRLMKAIYGKEIRET